jgi:phosphoribosyl-ATP pyrophosphohydrolase
MHKQLEQLREFHTAVSQKVGGEGAALGQPFIADDKIANFRANLIEEEAGELVDALKNEDKYAVLKEACDLIYVVLGMIVTYDMPIEEAFDRVHVNNMLKLTNGTIICTGKFQKPKDHPKTKLEDLFAKRLDVV